MKFMPVVTPKERTALMLFFVLAVLSIASFFTLDGFGRGIGLVLLAGYAGWLVREGLIKTDDPADEWWLAFTLARISVLIVGFAAIAVFVLGVWFFSFFDTYWGAALGAIIFVCLFILICRMSLWRNA